MKTVTLPADLFEDLCAEAEFHAAERPAGALGPHRAIVAEEAREVAAAGGFIEDREDARGRFRRRLVRLHGGATVRRLRAA